MCTLAAFYHLDFECHDTMASPIKIVINAITIATIMVCKPGNHQNSHYSVARQHKINTDFVYHYIINAWCTKISYQRHYKQSNS